MSTTKNLVIVESPAKAKTIEKYLGSGFVVKSSMGHIRGLPSKNGSIDVEHDFAPKFEVDADKRKTITELRKEVKNADTVWLASDEDREGEAISWHLSEVLKLDPKTTKRIVFHEITKSALEAAVANPRTIDMPLVEAQQARQALDYLVGFELSPVLWRKVRPKLSAGRVQSVAVRLIVEREREIDAHTPESTFKLSATFTLEDGTELTAEVPVKFKEVEAVQSILEAYGKSTFTVADITKKPGTRSPSAPFTTSTLQQEASNKLGYSPRTTMQLAQRLYEAGHITYMRTDSVNLSTLALGAMTDYIKGEYGERYHQFRTFKSKGGAQEAHEAIRPTDVRKTSAGADGQQEKLYNLIWRRTLASQMAPAQLEKTTITIKASQSDQQLEAKGEVVIFDGFLKAYGRSGDDTLLPPLTSGDPLTLITAEALESLSRGPARYTEASLVRQLEEMGIGRPSTYASTISTVQSRGYVERGDVEGVEKLVKKLSLISGAVKQEDVKIEYGKDTNKLVPTDTGNVVTDFLVKHFAEVMDYDFTKNVEEELDDIADSKKGRVEVLSHFYGPFHKLVEASADVSRMEASQGRAVGNDPKTGRPIMARFGRFGPMLQLGETGDEENKPTFATLPPGKKIETITLEEALKAFDLPRTLGTDASGNTIETNFGRFGPYLKVDGGFVSIKGHDPYTIDLTTATELLAEHAKKQAERFIKEFKTDGIQVLNGRFGPYITDGKKNAKIPKDVEPKDLTLEQAKEAIKSAPAKKARRKFTKKK